MIKAGQPCPLCTGRAGETSVLQPRQLGAFSGDEPPLRVTIQSMPALQCATGHTYFLKPDFPLWLTDQLIDEDAARLPAGEPKGFLLKRYRCHACGQPLAPREDHRHDFRVPVAYPGCDPFDVQLTMPVYKCTGCGKEQLHSLDELRKRTPAALVHAFKGAGIKGPR